LFSLFAFYQNNVKKNEIVPFNQKITARIIWKSTDILSAVRESRERFAEQNNED